MPKRAFGCAMILALVAFLGSALPVYAVLGADDGPAEVTDVSARTQSLEDVSTWLPESYFRGTRPGRLAFRRGKQPEVKVELPAENRPWSFDTFNGKHNLLAFRTFKSGSAGSKDFGQSPLEKYDTLLAYELNKNGSTRQISDQEAQAALYGKGAALWEADPSNEHNRAEVRCSSSRGTSVGKVREMAKEYLGDIDQVEVGGSSGDGGEVVVFRGRNFPVTRVTQGEHQGTSYTYYFYDQDVTYYLEGGASPLPSKARSQTQNTESGVTLAEGVFTQITGSSDRSKVGTWGHGAWEFNGIEWRRGYNPSVDARLERQASTGSRVSLRWGRNLEHRVESANYSTESYVREESETQPGRLPAPEDEWVMERRYEIDVYTYDSGVLLPGSAPGSQTHQAENRLVLFPSRRQRQALQRAGRSLPEGAGWEHQYWVEKDSSAGVIWSGHCAGFSAASVLFREPPARKTVQLAKAIRPVRLKASHAAEACRENLYYESFGEPVRSLTFENRDLKGLAVELGQSVEVGFEHPARDSGDRETPGVKIDYPTGAAGRWASFGTSQESWEDILPHNLHIILLDLLVQRKQSLVMDRHPCEPVWNSPVYGYEFTVTGNEAEHRYEVTAQVLYAGYGRSYGDGVKAPDTRGTETKVYPRDGVAPYAGDEYGKTIKGEALQFWLHVDDNNRVVRSQWKGRTVACTDYPRDASGRVTSRTKVPRNVPIHPDAIWVPNRLADSRRSQRGRVNRNPNLDSKLIFDLYPVLSENGEPYLHSWAR